MTTKLGGWHRLWIVTSVALLIPAPVLAYLFMPEPSSLAHEATYYTSLSAEAQAQLAPEGAADAGEIQMPNGHVVKVRNGIELTRKTPLLAEYAALLDRLLLRKRIEFAALVGGAWTAVCVLLLLAGLATAWVRRGFSSTQNAP